MAVSIQPLDVVHQRDLTYVSWRAAVLATLLALTLLALAFWVGTGERSYGFFAGMLVSATLYLASMGGEIRHLGWISLPFSESPTMQRFLGCTGVAFSNMFQRLYLDLPGRMPRLDRLLMALTLWMLALGVASVLFDGAWVAQAGNVGLLGSSLMILIGSASLALRGSRAGIVVLLSWLPLVIFSAVRALELMGHWGAASAWTVHALDASFALAALGLTLGLANKLLELRRDRDLASARASQDALTGSLSRHAIEEVLARVLGATVESPGALVSIAFVDLDHFKEINDRHGHAVGDQCLRHVVTRLRNRLRAQDLLGRYGGDEFLLVMPDTRLDEAVSIAEHLCTAVSCRPIDVSGVHLRVSLSIGVAQWRPGESASQLVRRADVALYSSKSAGRGRVSVGSPIPDPEGAR